MPLPRGHSRLICCGNSPLVWPQSCAGVCRGDWNLFLRLAGVFAIESSQECLEGLSICSLQQRAGVRAPDRGC